jgi:uncharacterized protein YkwD
MKLLSIVYATMLLLVTSLADAKGKPNCRLMQQLAQQHSNDMARRNSLDHAGFYNRGRQGARAENVAMGNSTRQRTMAQWRASPRHAANMRLRGCKAVAVAVSQSGRHYWTMIIGR